MALLVNEKCAQTKMTTQPAPWVLPAKITSIYSSVEIVSKDYIDRCLIAYENYSLSEGSEMLRLGWKLKVEYIFGIAR